jgi:hypothetical protein
LPVRLPAATQIAIRRRIPLPALFIDDFRTRYNPDNAVQQQYPVRNIDFTSSGAYAMCNWELYVHVPLLIAVHLSQNQKIPGCAAVVPLHL